MTNHEPDQQAAFPEGNELALLALKCLVYSELEQQNLETSIHLLRAAIVAFHDDAKNNSDARIPLEWCKANYYHLLGDSAKAQHFYREVASKIRNCTSDIEEVPTKKTLHNILFLLVQSDVGDFFWYSKNKDMALSPYEMVTRLIFDSLNDGIVQNALDSSRKESTTNILDLIRAEAKKKISNDQYCVVKNGLNDALRILPTLIQEKHTYAVLRYHQLSERNANPHDMTVWSGSTTAKFRELHFLIGQNFGTRGNFTDFMSAADEFKKALLGADCNGESDSDGGNIWRSANLNRALNDPLVRRYAICHFLAVLLSNFPVTCEWRTGKVLWLRPREDGTCHCGNSEPYSKYDLEKFQANLERLQGDIKQFKPHLVDTTVSLKLAEFIEQSQCWAIEYYNVLLDFLQQPKKPTAEDLKHIQRKLVGLNIKMAYVVTNSYYFFHDFLNRKREFDDCATAKLFTPAINLIPRNKNVFSVLRRWNSASPLISRGRKLAVTLRQKEWPEDMRHGTDMVSQAFHDPASKGGGYFLRWYNYGVVIDPGIFFFENFLEFYSFDDIDLIVVTHDHPDHQFDIKSLLTLMSQSKRSGRRRAPIDFWIDPGSCAEFYAYILNLHSLELIAEEKSKERGETPSPRLVGNIFPYYKQESEYQSAVNKPNVWKVSVGRGHAKAEIELRAIYNSKHKTLNAHRQTFGMLLKLQHPAPNKKNTIVYITGDGAFSEETIARVDETLTEWGQKSIDILVPHLGSIIEEDLIDFKTFDDGVYPTHLGARGLIQLYRSLRAKKNDVDLVVVSEFGEELKGHRRNFCTHVAFHLALTDGDLDSPDYIIQRSLCPTKVIPGDIGFTLSLDRDSLKKEFICRLCFEACPLEDLVVRTSGAELVYVCSECDKVFYDADEPANNAADGRRQDTELTVGDLLGLDIQ